MTPQQMVTEFHEKIGGQTVPTTPQIRNPKLRLDLILEELQELGAATGHALMDGDYEIGWYNEDDYREYQRRHDGFYGDEDDEFAPKENLVEAADAIADLLYVVYGTAVDFGINIEPIFAEVHRSNMTKTPGLLREDGKILKGDTFEPPQIERLLNLQAREAWVTPLNGGPAVSLVPECRDCHRPLSLAADRTWKHPDGLRGTPVFPDE